MKNRKTSADWYLAATHYLTSGFAIPLIVNALVYAFVTAIGLPVEIFNLLGYLVNPIAMWFGVIYSANYIGKTYFVNNKIKIVNLATIYLIVWYMIVNIGSLLLQPPFDLKIKIITFIISLVYLGIFGGIFYYASKKYIKNTSEIDV